MSYLLFRQLGCRKLLFLNNAVLLKRCYAKGRDQPSGCVQHIYQRPYEAHYDKNRRLKRPLTPCLSIYKIQICSVCSIMHRITGMVTSFYLFGLAAYSLLASHDFTYLCQCIECLKIPGIILSLFKFGLAFPCIYHSINGIRHLSWDTGRFLSMTAVSTTGILTMAVAATAAAGVSFLM